MSTARVRRAGMIQVHGVTTEHDVIWQIGNGPTRETPADHVIHACSNVAHYTSGVVGLRGEGSVEYVNESDLGALHDALKARNRGEGHPLCLSCHRASVVYGLDVCSGCNDGAELRDEPRRIEPDHAFIPTDDEPELSQWANEHGYTFTPGQWPIGGAL